MKRKLLALPLNYSALNDYAAPFWAKIYRNNMATKKWITNLVILFSLSPLIHASGELKSVDISNGIVFSSDRTAIFENSANLAVYGNKNLEFAAAPPISNSNVQGQIAFSMANGKNFGLGIAGIYNATDTALGNGSFAIKTGLGVDIFWLKLGMMASTNPVNFSSSYQLSALINIKNFSLAFVMPAAFNLTSWRAGLGLNLGSFLIETNFRNNGSNSYTIMGSVSYIMPNKIQLQFGIDQALSSVSGFALVGSIGLNGGIYYWILPSLALGSLYNHESFPWMFSLKWKIG